MSTDDYLAALGITQFVLSVPTQSSAPLVDAPSAGYCYRLSAPDTSVGYLVASAAQKEPSELALLTKLMGALGADFDGGFVADINSELTAGPSAVDFLILSGELPALSVDAPVVIRTQSAADLLARPDLKRPLWQALKTQLPFLASA